MGSYPFLSTDSLHILLHTHAHTPHTHTHTPSLSKASIMKGKSFRQTHTLEERRREAERIKRKYDNRVPVIAECAKGSSLPEIDKKKYLVPSDLTVAQFQYVIRKPSSS